MIFFFYKKNDNPQFWRLSFYFSLSIYFFLFLVFSPLIFIFPFSHFYSPFLWVLLSFCLKKKRSKKCILHKMHFRKIKKLYKTKQKIAKFILLPKKIKCIFGRVTKHRLNSMQVGSREIEKLYKTRKLQYVFYYLKD